MHAYAGRNLLSVCPCTVICFVSASSVEVSHSAWAFLLEQARHPIYFGASPLLTVHDLTPLQLGFRAQTQLSVLAQPCSLEE
mmetsp:Transcript_11120/g.27675  ORF Transcript_11120/g.27675 Transcript_11120/m.27675 type:complete len:82 (-) Transcript_11120:44-289(-)